MFDNYHIKLHGKIINTFATQTAADFFARLYNRNNTGMHQGAIVSKAGYDLGGYTLSVHADGIKALEDDGYLYDMDVDAFDRADYAHAKHLSTFLCWNAEALVVFNDAIEEAFEYDCNLDRDRLLAELAEARDRRETEAGLMYTGRI